ncbi:thioredoxin family protein [Marinirhabdus gelatinilytica]|uniref:AhpC/TSA family protein n=1 Tax=Marinirhabdus gelatinilytica TaxID=1703343 RepID=A0A370Q4F9_9FLAO|nr:thioredoxin family protein [Marinirhabdus gelatinilytica]RDK83268.1 AhpC/TSA family protein [Marinirhabdus gelatinilytica]
MKTNMLKPVLFFALALFLVSCQETKEKETKTKTETTEKKEVAMVDKTETNPKGYGIGDIASDFDLKDVNGDMVSLADYKDAKGFVVIFTCNTCPFAVASEERMVALDKKYKEKGYPVIAINPNDPEVQPDDTYELMQKKAKEAGFTFPYLYDASNTVYATYGATKTPHVYLLQKQDEGNVVKYIGAIDDNVRNGDAVKEQFLANAIDELLAGKEITVKETKAIGCSVKQKKA